MYITVILSIHCWATGSVQENCWLGKTWHAALKMIEVKKKKQILKNKVREELKWWQCSISILIALIKDYLNCLSSICVSPKQKKNIYITKKVHLGTFQSSEGHWFFRRKVTVYVRVVTSSSEISSATGKHRINVQHINTNVAAGGSWPR